MERTQAAGSASGKFVDSEITAGIAGTTISAADLNAHQEEIVTAIEAAGLAPSRSEDQLMHAVPLLAGAALLPHFFTRGVIGGMVPSVQDGVIVVTAGVAISRAGRVIVAHTKAERAVDGIAAIRVGVDAAGIVGILEADAPATDFVVVGYIDQETGAAKMDAHTRDVAYHTLDPIGKIDMWTGDFLNDRSRPGWYVCDGTNGTPDLRETFLRGNSTSGGTGGENEHMLTAVEMPSHLHSAGSLYAATAGRHAHQIGLRVDGAFAGSHGISLSGTFVHAKGYDRGMAVEGLSGSAFAPYNATYKQHVPISHYEPAHGHAMFGATGREGGSQAHNNQPKFFDVVLIMRMT